MIVNQYTMKMCDEYMRWKIRDKIKECLHDKIMKINEILYEKIKINSVVMINVDVKRERKRWQGYC